MQGFYVQPGSLLQVAIAYPGGCVSHATAFPGCFVSLVTQVPRRPLRPDAPVFQPRDRLATVRRVLIAALVRVRAVRRAASTIRRMVDRRRRWIAAVRRVRAVTTVAARLKRRCDQQQATAITRFRAVTTVAVRLKRRCDLWAILTRFRVVCRVAARLKVLSDRVKTRRQMVKATQLRTRVTRRLFGEFRAAVRAHKERRKQRWAVDLVRWRVYGASAMSAAFRFVITHRVLSAIRDTYMSILTPELRALYPGLVDFCLEGFDTLNARAPIMSARFAMLIGEEFEILMGRFHHESAIGLHMIHPTVNAVFLQIPSLMAFPLMELHMCLSSFYRLHRLGRFTSNPAILLGKCLERQFDIQNPYIEYELKTWHESNTIAKNAPARWALYHERQHDALKWIASKEQMRPFRREPQSHGYSYLKFWLTATKTKFSSPTKPYTIGPKYLEYCESIKAAFMKQETYPKTKIRERINELRRARNKHT